MDEKQQDKLERVQEAREQLGITKFCEWPCWTHKKESGLYIVKDVVLTSSGKSRVGVVLQRLGAETPPVFLPLGTFLLRYCLY